ncbi:hypothetical protein Bca4012_076544 [Brassica carinata]
MNEVKRVLPHLFTNRSEQIETQNVHASTKLSYLSLPYKSGKITGSRRGENKAALLGVSWFRERVIMKFCSLRIAKYGFDYVYFNNMNKVTAVHKANIVKFFDGFSWNLVKRSPKVSRHHLH